MVFDDEPKELQALKDHYTRGGLGDSIVKKRLLEKLEQVLTPIGLKRLELEKNMDDVYKILAQGTQRAKHKAALKLQMAKEAMGIDYPFIR
jgi:tryptophanyl-tRNA synthetase